MNRRLLFHYNNELAHLRQNAAEFAREFPKVAGRLAVDPEGKAECPDPFVERLLEGVAYLNARIQLKFDAAFPQLTESLIETVYPHFLAPTPSMLVARFDPELDDASLAEGYEIPRGTILRSNLGQNSITPCEFSIGQPVVLWPLQLKGADYFTREIEQLGLPSLPAGKAAKAAVRLQIDVCAGLTSAALALDKLCIYIRGEAEIPVRIYESIFARLSGVVVQSGTGRLRRSVILGPDAVRQVGFESDEALLPSISRSFEGYRLLTEYFHFPQRFLFFEVSGLKDALKQLNGTSFDLNLIFESGDTMLENRIDASTFELFATPAINLIPRRLDRIHVSDRFPEYHVVADKTRPLDYEIHSLTRVEGIGGNQDDLRPFTPFYFNHDRNLHAQAYYTVHRRPRVLSENERRTGQVSKYRGSEMFLSLVDGRQAPFHPDVQQISLSALVTNRHLPIQMPVGVGRTDFHLEINAPTRGVYCITGPSAPVPVMAGGEASWRIISHLTLNYLSIIDPAPQDREVDEGDSEEPSDPNVGGKHVTLEPAAALREMLGLYAAQVDPAMKRHVQGIVSVGSRRTTRRIRTPGPIAFARGLEVHLEFQESEFSGFGAFILGSVLDRFLGKYVSINSFTATVIRTVERGIIKRWPVSRGRRYVI